VGVHPDVLPGRKVQPQVNGMSFLGHLVEGYIGGVRDYCGLFCPALVALPMRGGLFKLHPVNYDSWIHWIDLNGDDITVEAIAELRGKGDLTSHVQRLYLRFADVPSTDGNGRENTQAESQQEKEKLPHYGSHLLSAHTQKVSASKNAIFKETKRNYQ
jgi:hypothetical protein